MTLEEKQGAAPDEAEADADFVEVVIIDDEKDFADEIVEFLSRRSFRCRTFNHPFDALDHFRQTRANAVVLTDQRMPGMRGLDLAVRLRQLEKQNSGRLYEIIMFSAFADLDHAIEALKCGIMDFLIKPFDLKRLEATVIRAIDRVHERADQRQQSERLDRTLQKAYSLAATLSTALPPRAEPVTADHREAVDATGSAISGGRTPGLPKTEAATTEQMLKCVKFLQATRRMRDDIFPISADDDAIWEIILYSVEQHMLGRIVPVTSACHATLLPQTTAMRKIDLLVEAGLLVRTRDAHDKRRMLISPTPACIERCQTYFSRTIAKIEAFAT